MKKFFISALMMLGFYATAQEKVNVHVGSKSYVTTIDYITFDAKNTDQVVSVSDLQSENTTLKSQIANLQNEKTELENAMANLRIGTNGYEYVDFELPSGTLWATMNVGANAPEQFGDYFAWGEVTAKQSNSWNNYFDTKDGGTTFAKYNGTNGKNELDWYNDAASINWRGAWQTPSNAQMNELKQNCYWVWTTSYKNTGIMGYIVYKAKISSDKGKRISVSYTPSSDYDVAKDIHIFLPAAGGLGTNPYKENEAGYYWTRSLNSTTMRADDLNFTQTTGALSNYLRYNGCSIRPVCPGK